MILNFSLGQEFYIPQSSGFSHLYVHSYTMHPYLVLSPHYKYEPSRHRMQGQPADQWETRFGNMIQAVISKLLGQAWLLTTHNTLFKVSLQGSCSSCFQLSSFWGHHSAILADTVTFWPTCSFARWYMITSRLTSALFGVRWCADVV